MSELDTNAERIRKEYQSEGIKRSSENMVDRSMLQMDDRANYVTLDGDQACAMLALEELYSAQIAWWNREPQWRTIKNKLTGEPEKIIVEVDYSSIPEFKQSCKSKQITIDGDSRKMHLHVVDSLKPLEQTEEKPSGFLSFFQKK